MCIWIELFFNLTKYSIFLYLQHTETCRRPLCPPTPLPPCHVVAGRRRTQSTHRTTDLTERTRRKTDARPLSLSHTHTHCSDQCDQGAEEGQVELL